MPQITGLMTENALINWPIRNKMVEIGNHKVGQTTREENHFISSFSASLSQKNMSVIVTYNLDF